MSDRVPTFSWSPPDDPILLKQSTQDTLGFSIVEETQRGSRIFRARDLTGLTAWFSMFRESAPGSGTLVSEIASRAMTIPSPPSGQVFVVIAETDDLPDGDHLVELKLKSGTVVVARIPRGRAYLRAIVGKKLEP